MTKLKYRRAYLGLAYLLVGVSISISAGAQVRENPNAFELPAVENKALIDALIVRIESETKGRRLKAFEKGEVLAVNPTGEESIRARLHNGTVYLIDDTCSDVTEITNWNFLFYPLKLNTSAEFDFRTPRNLKGFLKKNGQIFDNGASKSCISYVKLPSDKAYKIVGFKNTKAKRIWTFEKEFAELSDYLDLNRIEQQNKLAPTDAAVCKIATKLCYKNTKKRKYVANLTGRGLVGDNLTDMSSDEFFLETRRTNTEIEKLFPKFEIKTITPVESNIANYISKNLEHTVVLSVRDNAMRHLKPSDVQALNLVGVDFRTLLVRGAHVTILKPGSPPINVTDNAKPVLLSSEDHGVSELGTVSSAGFAMGDNSTINLAGVNVSSNLRGINIAVIDSKGRLVRAKNFDTHIAPNRSQGLYKVNVNK